MPVPRLPILRKLAALCCVASCLFLAAEPTGAATPEAQVKAAYLYKFASFVRWPPSVRQAESMSLCIVGRSDIATVLRTLVRGQRIEGKPIELRMIDAAGSDAARSCQILFLGSGPETAQTLVTATRGQPVLTVGDRNNGTGRGAIDFIVRDGKVRFVVDTGDARARGLDLSSKLLDVAVAVE